MAVDACSAEAFEDRYAASPDPWDFARSPYEQGRYDAIIAALGRDRYAAGYEPACSIGALTVRLAGRCDRLRAVDVSPTAVARTVERCQGLSHVDVAVASVADDAIGARDLIVFSEVGYYFDVPGLDRLIARLVASLVDGGELVACHWLGDSVDHRLHGSMVHDRLRALVPFDLVRHATEPGFVLDVWQRA